MRQVVLLAAGLDSRAYRLAWPAGTVICELDQPQVLEFKRELLATRGEIPNAHRVEVAVDLRDDWPQASLDSGFVREQPAAFLAEGLMIYLPVTAQEMLVRGIDELAAPGSQVGIEEGQPMPDQVFKLFRSAEQTDGGADGTFFQLI